MTKYIQPQRGKKSFTCPHCGVFSQQDLYADNATLQYGGIYNERTEHFPISTSVCTHCKGYVIWNLTNKVYPISGDAPLPNPDMPDDVKITYLEASSILGFSPRGSAALLRLGIQLLCMHLGCKGKSINDDIGKLVKDGLPEKLQQALDIVRVIGNNAVHPGQIETDDPETAQSLFHLTNIIVESMISVPKRVNNLYATLPAVVLDGITKRDGN